MHCRIETKCFDIITSKRDDQMHFFYLICHMKFTKINNFVFTILDPIMKFRQDIHFPTANPRFLDKTGTC